MHSLFQRAEGTPESEPKPDPFYDVWTDGSSTGKVGPGGWAAIILKEDEVLAEHSGNEYETTNNRMEVQAACIALEALPEKSFVRVHSDSSYLINPMRRHWVKKWRRNGWLTWEGLPVENRDLWMRLDNAVLRHYRVDWKKVKGHSGVEYNERADKLAKAARKQVILEDDV